MPSSLRNRRLTSLPPILYTHHTHNPDAHLLAQTRLWEPRWHPKEHQLNDALNRLLLRIRSLARTAAAQADSYYNTEYLDNSVNAYKKETNGGDAWTNTDIKKAPTKVKERLATSIRYSTKKAVQPIQNMLNLHPLLGKPGGGSRTICKTPMLYRHTLRGREQVALWEEANTGPFDTSGKGKSARLAAAYRSIKAEVYGQTEDQVIAVFHDFEKFFDTIDIPTLIEKALELQFPVLDLALTIMQHLAPRVIQCDAFCSKPILGNRSILAGCRHSEALTRVLMLTGITKLNMGHPLVATDVYVDDTAMLTYGERQESLDSITRAVIDFAKFANNMHLKLSHKGVIVAKIQQDDKN